MVLNVIPDLVLSWVRPSTSIECPSVAEKLLFSGFTRRNFRSGNGLARTTCLSSAQLNLCALEWMTGNLQSVWMIAWTGVEPRPVQHLTMNFWHPVGIFMWLLLKYGSLNELQRDQVFRWKSRQHFGKKLPNLSPQ